MPEPSPGGQERLARFLAILVYELGEDRLARILERVNEGEVPLHSLSFFASIAGDKYMEEILEVDRSGTEVNINQYEA